MIIGEKQGYPAYKILNSYYYGFTCDIMTINNNS